MRQRIPAQAVSISESWLHACGQNRASSLALPVLWLFKPSESTQKGRKREEPGQASPAAADAAKSQANQPKIAGGNCDLDSNLLPKMLEQAEKSREEGNYPAALRQFRAVLACDRNNARARSGLDLTEFGMQHR